MKNKIIASLIILVFMIGTGYHFYKVIMLNTTIKSLKFKQSISLELENDVSQNEFDYYKKLSLRSINILSEVQLIELAKLEWDYKLMINGEEFKGQNINIEGNSFDMVLSEMRDERSILPEKLRQEGQIKNYFFKHLTLEARRDPEITNTDSEFTTSINYKFSELVSGDKIKISLSEELSNRLGLSNKNYVIYIK